MSRAILIKNKLVDIINELTAGDSIRALRVYVSNDTRGQKSVVTNVFPIEERTRYVYAFEDGMRTIKSGTTTFLLGGLTYLTSNTLNQDNDIAYQRYSTIVEKLEDKLISYQETQILNASGNYKVSFTLIDSSSDAIANEGIIKFNINIRCDWERI